MKGNRGRTRTAALLVMAGIAVFGGRLGVVTSEDRMEMAGHYAEYTSSDPDFVASFAYPEGWSLDEERGTMEAYREVRVRGPRNADDTYTSYLAVRASPLKTAGGPFATTADAVEHYMSRLPAGAVVASRETRVVAGLTADDLTVDYTLPPLHLHGLKPTAIPIKTRTVFLERGSYLYELILSADAREFPRQAETFERLVATVRFRE